MEGMLYSFGMKLNVKQEEAARALEGPVLVLAGAGAGKTGTLTERMINLIKNGTPPQSILALTFTNKAAGEMKDRVRASVQKMHKTSAELELAWSLPWVGTFHALGVMILKEQHRELGIKKHFSIYDRDDARRAIKEAIKQCDLDPKAWDTKQILGFISSHKGKNIALEDIRAQGDSSYYFDTLIQIWERYEEIKRQDGAFDFDDLLLETAKLLAKREDIRRLYQTRFRYIHIDEYQDTNRVQYQIVKLLINPETQNIFCVGDPDQLIYGWRGAEIGNIMRFEKDFKDSKTIILEQNYRSMANIITASNEVIAHNTNRFKKELQSTKDDGELISLYGAYDAREEARWLAREISMLIESGKDPGSMAVLYRANFQSRALEEACLSANIPYQVLGTKFFDRSEVKDVMAYIRAAFNPDALIDVRRVINMPRRGIGKVALVKIFSHQTESLPAKTAQALSLFYIILDDIASFAQENSPSETVQYVIERSGLEKMYRASGKEEDLERLANMYELGVVAEKYDTLDQENALEKFLEEIALLGDQDTKQDEQASVKLMTIHAAKGLEFDTVFLTGCEEDLFSPRREMDQKAIREKSEEERRLFYVAMTRARDKLYLSWASLREVFGTTMVNTLVSFVGDIPPALIQEEAPIHSGTLASGATLGRYDDYDGIDTIADDGEQTIELLDW
ncbi:MAG: ATP-dependent helicase [Patescibacteria group bacterium]